MSKRTTTVSFEASNVKTAGYLSTRFIIVDIIVKTSADKIEKLQLVNCKAEITATGSFGAGTVNPNIKNDITIYSSLNGYDESTSLLTKIKEAVDSERSAKQPATNDLVSLVIRLGYMSLPRSTDYILTGDVFNIASYRDEGKRSQAWKFEMYSSDLYNNSFNPIFKKTNMRYLKGSTTYLQILKDLYTPNGEKVSSLDQPYYSLQLDEDLKTALDTPIKETCDMIYSEKDGKTGAAFSNKKFSDVISSFWGFTKHEGGPLVGRTITVKFTKPEGDLANKATITFYDKESKILNCAFLDDSVLSSVEKAEAGVLNVTTLFDPTVFIRDGIILKTRYFSSTTIPSQVSLISAGTDVIVDRYATLKEEVDKNTPVWYIVTYELNFNNTSASPCITTLLLSRDYIPWNLL